MVWTSVQKSLVVSEKSTKKRRTLRCGSESAVVFNFEQFISSFGKIAVIENFENFENSENFKNYKKVENFEKSENFEILMRVLRAIFRLTCKTLCLEKRKRKYPLLG